MCFLHNLNIEVVSVFTIIFEASIHYHFWGMNFFTYQKCCFYTINVPSLNDLAVDGTLNTNKQTNKHTINVR